MVIYVVVKSVVAVIDLVAVGVIFLAVVVVGIVVVVKLSPEETCPTNRCVSVFSQVLSVRVYLACITAAYISPTWVRRGWLSLRLSLSETASKNTQ